MRRVSAHYNFKLLSGLNCNNAFFIDKDLPNYILINYITIILTFPINSCNIRYIVTLKLPLLYRLHAQDTPHFLHASRNEQSQSLLVCYPCPLPPAPRLMREFYRCNAMFIGDGVWCIHNIKLFMNDVRPLPLTRYKLRESQPRHS